LDFNKDGIDDIIIPAQEGVEPSAENFHSDVPLDDRFTYRGFHLIQFSDGSTENNLKTININKKLWIWKVLSCPNNNDYLLRNMTSFPIDLNNDGYYEIFCSINHDDFENKYVWDGKLCYRDIPNEDESQRWNEVYLVDIIDDNGNYITPPSQLFDRANKILLEQNRHTNYFPFSYNGDGQSYIMQLTKSERIDIRKYNPNTNSLEIIKTVNKFYKNNIANTIHESIVDIADFNGDGLTDILMTNKNDFYTEGTTNHNERTKWGLYLWNGIDFIETSHPLGNSLWDDYNSNASFDRYIGDFNGDGKSDIITKKYRFGDSTYYEYSFYTLSSFSIGSSHYPYWHKETKRFNRNDFASEKDYNMHGCVKNAINKYQYSKAVTAYVPQKSFSEIDLNGDNHTDIYSWGVDDMQPYHPQSIFHFYNRNTNGLLKSVEDGLQNKLNISYEPISKGGTLYEKDNNALSEFPLNYFNNGIVVTSAVESVPSLANYTSMTTSYSYSKAIGHKFGGGFLGFEKFVTSKPNEKGTQISEMINTSITIVNESDNKRDQYALLNTKNVNKINVPTATPQETTISEVDNVYLVKNNLTSPFSGKYFICPITTVSRDYLTNISTKTDYLYDDKQQITNQQTIVYNYLYQSTNSLTDGIVSASITENSYSYPAFNSTVAFLLDSTRTITTRSTTPGIHTLALDSRQWIGSGDYWVSSSPNLTISSSPDYCSQRTYFNYSDASSPDYSAHYRLTSKVSNPLASHNTYKLTESYSYDSYGHVVSTTLADTDPTTTDKVSQIEYSLDGRFILEKRNSLNDAINYTYNKHGQLIEEEDVIGNITKYYYDAFGTMYKTEKPNGTINWVESFWVTPGVTAPSGVKYKIRNKVTYGVSGSSNYEEILSYKYLNSIGLEYYTQTEVGIGTSNSYPFGPIYTDVRTYTTYNQYSNPDIVYGIYPKSGSYTTANYQQNLYDNYLRPIENSTYTYQIGTSTFAKTGMVPENCT